jgi:hypothetical protein
VNPHESGTPALPHGRDQHVDHRAPRSLDTPQSDGRGPGNHASGSGVQQRGHAALLGGRRARDGQEYPGQQSLPRPAGAQPLAQCARGHPVRHHLAPADDLILPRQGGSERGVVMLG